MPTARAEALEEVDLPLPLNASDAFHRAAAAIKQSENRARSADERRLLLEAADRWTALGVGWRG